MSLTVALYIIAMPSTIFPHVDVGYLGKQLTYNHDKCIFDVFTISNISELWWSYGCIW